MHRFRFQWVAIIAGAFLVSACSAANLTPSSTASTNHAMKPLTLNLGANTYSTSGGRNLDSGDDSQWWTMGGSYGQSTQVEADAERRFARTQEQFQPRHRRRLESAG